jgi:hypothetical protein
MDSEPDDLKAPKNTRWPIVVIVLLLVGATGYVAYRVFQEPRGSTEAPVMDAGVALPVDAGPALSLVDGDALLKKLAPGWSSHALFLKWLESLGLRHVVAAAQLVADGESPRPALPFLSIAAPFAVREVPPPDAKPARAGKRKAPAPPSQLFIADESYARYDEVTAVVTSVNAAAVGDAWAQLRPFLEVAYGEIGRPGTHFDDTLTMALRRLVLVHFPEGDVELVPEGAVYAFKDPALQSATKAEKHLLRMGKKNGEAIQAALRDFATHAHLDLGP